MIDYSTILTTNFPNSEWSLNAEDYSSLQWFSDTPKPTQEQLDALAASTEEAQAKNTCKTKAKQILYETDWTSISDVGNPQTANPYLANQAAFIAYRSIIRNYAINPVVNPTWPTLPTEQWVTAPTA
jgi:hypothetical protein